MRRNEARLPARIMHRDRPTRGGRGAGSRAPSPKSAHTHVTICMLPSSSGIQSRIAEQSPMPSPCNGEIRFPCTVSNSQEARLDCVRVNAECNVTQLGIGLHSLGWSDRCEDGVDTNIISFLFLHQL